MRKMKDSGIAWIGEIPEEWETKRLKFICTINPMVNIDDINPETEVSFLPMENIKYGYFVNTIIKNFSEYCSSYNIFNDGDILLAKVTPCFENGNIAIANNLKNCIGFGTSEIFVVRVNNIDNKFLFYYFRNELFRQRAIATMSGTGGLKRISPQFMRDENVLFPPLPEQRRIASYLDTKCAEIDRSMELVRQSIDKLKEYKMSIITEAVTKGLDPDVPMKDSGIAWIGEIPEGWEVRKFKDIFVFNRGLPITKKNLVEIGIPVLSYGQIHAKENTGTRVNTELFRFVPQIYLNTHRESLLNIGDILFADTSEDYEGIGNNIYIDLEQKIFAGYHTIICRPIINLKTKYLPYLFQTDIWRSQLRANVSGIKVFSITQKLLRDTFVIFPHLQEQHSIASYLDAKCAEIDAIIAKKQELLDKLTAYKKSLIFECVTGKREIAA